MWFRNGNCWYTPGSFRKSGKHRAYRIRNLKEYTENGICTFHFAYRNVTGLGGEILKELEGPRAGRAWVAGWPLYPTRVGIYGPDKVGVYGPDKIGTYDRKGCGGQAEGSCRIDETIIAHW